MDAHAPLLVFSHLRWDFVFQRPQHLMTRLAQRRKVYFIEEPISDGTREPFWERVEVNPQLVVCRPHTPVTSHGFSDEQLAVLKPMLQEFIASEQLEDFVLWFYTPLALPLADALQPRAIVYDCMDELSAFLNAPSELLARETQLLDKADVVFTGGPSLYQAKKDRHPNVHCFSSSVDVNHFAHARAGNAEASDQAALPHPRLGFFGVIDERLDVELLRVAAGKRADWQFVLVGPVVKIDPAALPRRTNLHYLGQRTYQELPSYIAGWDVCLLPFAHNQATKYISPTKTLEYMAAEKPIVSTTITDVAQPYGDIVYLGDTPDDFVAACERALNDSSEERQRRLERMRRVLAGTSWDQTARQMDELIEEAVQQRAIAKTRNRIAIHGSRWERIARTDASDQEYRSERPTVVVGAGPTGLSASFHLGPDAVLLEQNERVGGWCRSIEANGFTFDFAGHIMFSNNPYVHELYQKLLGDNVHWQDREAWIYSKGVHTRYPFQGSLYGLPAEVIKECLIGAIEARFGSLSGKPNPAPAISSNGNGHAANGHSANGHNGNGHQAHDGNGHHHNGNGQNGGCEKGVTDCCADGILESTTKLQHANGNGQSNGSSQPANFEEFIYKVWGAGIAKHFAIPYNRKLWAVPLNEMETSWLGGRVPMPDLGEMIEGALKPSPKPMGPNARFGYPLRGGFQALMDAFLPLLEGELRLNTRAKAVRPDEHELLLQDGTTLQYDHLISTMPLPVLIRSMGNVVPDEIREAAAGLRYVSVRCVHIGVGRENITEKHWIYYPEDTVFHRIFVQGNASPSCNPPGGFGLTCEITYSPHKPLPCDGDELIQRCIDDCRKVGIMRPDDPVLVGLQCDLPHAYVVYDHARPKLVEKIRKWLLERDIILAGRYSEWEYYNSDHAFLAGKKAAEMVRERQHSRRTTAQKDVLHAVASHAD